MLRVTVLVMLARLVVGVFDAELHEKYLQMPKDEFIEYFNSQGYSWKITEYDDKIIRKHGAHINYEDLKNFPVQSHDANLLKDLPKNFDSREKWPNCKSIKEINDQGDCGSCWTFGAANTASDRTCIHKGINVHLSEQTFECLELGVCSGGVPGFAFFYWETLGLVSKECKPYNVTKLKIKECLHQCVNRSIDYEQDTHHADNVYQITNKSVDSIKAELFHFGPIQAAFTVFADFFAYNGGIYEHKYGDKAGGHSVRIIGYGVENNTEYWLVANSWGKNWGEKGLFRIKTLQDDVDFEGYLLSGMPKD